VARASDTVKAQAWRSRFARFETSGVKTAEFCAGEGVSLANFYAWRRKLRLSKRRASKESGKIAFQQVVVSAAPALAVCLSGGVRMEVSDASEQSLRTIISELVRATSEIEPR
jgi:hypothetical protein